MIKSTKVRKEKNQTLGLVPRQKRNENRKENGGESLYLSIPKESGVPSNTASKCVPVVRDNRTVNKIKKKEKEKAMKQHLYDRCRCRPKKIENKISGR